MIDNINEEIAKINDNILILPKKNKKDREKVVNYIDDTINKYNEKLKDIKAEMDKRYNKIINIKETGLNDEVLNDKVDYDFVKKIDPIIDSYSKMDLDYLLYKVKHYYQDDLKSTNDIILTIINKFKEVGINLKNSDFNYSKYVNMYMSALLRNDNTYDLLNNIYWECPTILSQVGLNIKSIYLNNKKKIDKYYSNKNNKLSLIEYINRKNDNFIKKYEIDHNNGKLMLNKFIEKELLISDYSIVNISKLKESLFIDDSNSHNYENLNQLYLDSNDYVTYLKYSYLIEDLKKLYKDKSTYKGLYDKKVKDIIKLEKELNKVVSKLGKTGFGSLDDTKRELFKLKADTLINDLQLNYEELDDIMVKEDIIKQIGDEDNWLKYLRLVVNNYNYMVKIIKSVDENVSIDEINDRINILKDYLYGKNNNILSSVLVNNEVNIPRMIADKYKLFHLNIKEASFEADNIDAFIKSIYTLIINNDLIRLGIDLNDIDFILDVNKIKNTK